MQNNIYISTSTFKGKELKDILQMSLDNGITNLELGSYINYSEDNVDLVLKYNRSPMKFLIHNYFPPQKEGFVINLASDDKEILLKSIDHCKCAIDLSSRLGSPFYSLHSGFAFHARPEDLGRKQVDLPRIPYKQAYQNFVDSVIELTDYASKKNVKLAVENNVVANFNLVNGRNEILILAEAEEALSFYKEVGSSNLFFLIDLGHLNVSAASLGFSQYDYIDKLLPYTIAFHVNDNDSIIDSHLKFDKNVWYSDILAENKDKIFIIEASNLETNEIFGCYKTLINIFNNKNEINKNIYF